MFLTLLAVWANCAQTRIPALPVASAGTPVLGPVGTPVLAPALPPAPRAAAALSLAPSRLRIAAAAKRHEFLLVPGLLWDVVDDYFQPNHERLQRLGYRSRILDVDPLGSTKQNGLAVAAALREAKRPVVILAHSKGALDSLEALRAEPELVGKVKALVAIQTPYFGAAFADWAAKPKRFRDLSILIARLLMRPGRLLRTSPFARDEALLNISKEARRRASEPLPEGLEVYSIATRLTIESRVPWVSWATAGTLRLFSGDSDGLVETKDALIPGSRQAVLEHVSHIDTVSDPVHWKHRVFGARRAGYAAELTEAIVRWIFGEARRS
ncbi:MAG: hypothetical protein HY553_21050 [Elusimicrobia bacterium]|nr:hypothetical protein [Elusimicrobiota bacterium]